MVNEELTKQESKKIYKETVLLKHVTLPFVIIG